MKARQKGIYWLASFPKSGNTWFRIVLKNMLNASQDLSDLDSINTGAIASSRVWIDEVLGFDSAMLTDAELDALLPAVYSYHHEQAESIEYHKIHNAYTYLDKAKRYPLIPPKSCLGAVYLIRNPLDVVISYANHNSCSIDHAIMMMGNRGTAMQNRYGQSAQVRHKMGTWSSHVESWVDAESIDVFTIRYEDMKLTPVETFSKAMAFLQLEFTQEQMIQAVENTQFEKLQAIEQEKGFKERPPKAKTFFRKGRIDDWKETLSSEQIRQVVRDHAVVMNRFGYLHDELVDYF